MGGATGRRTTQDRLHPPWRRDSWRPSRLPARPGRRRATRPAHPAPGGRPPRSGIGRPGAAPAPACRRVAAGSGRAVARPRRTRGGSRPSGPGAPKGRGHRHPRRGVGAPDSHPSRPRFGVAGPTSHGRADEHRGRAKALRRAVPVRLPPGVRVRRTESGRHEVCRGPAGAAGRQDGRTRTGRVPPAARRPTGRHPRGGPGPGASCGTGLHRVPGRGSLPAVRGSGG